MQRMHKVTDTTLYCGRLSVDLPSRTSGGFRWTGTWTRQRMGPVPYGPAASNPAQRSPRRHGEDSLLANRQDLSLLIPEHTLTMTTHFGNSLRVDTRRLTLRSENVIGHDDAISGAISAKKRFVL